jgi:hypothetical protein
MILLKKKLKKAKKRNIELIYVLKGLTYKYQPFVVLINGILKQKAKKLWRQEMIKKSLVNLVFIKTYPICARPHGYLVFDSF